MTKLALFAARDRVVMTLRKMRQNGVRSLSITCDAIHCHHQAILDVSAFADDVVVPFSARAWLARSAALSARMRGLTGMNVHQPACSDPVRRTPFLVEHRHAYWS